MTLELGAVHTRRAVLTSGLLMIGGAAASAMVPKPARALYEGAAQASATAVLTARPAPSTSKPVRTPLFDRALTALDQHGRQIRHRDRIAIADFAAPSSQPRFHIVDLEGGKTRHFLVAHGRGSDPEHSGWLHRFSNRDGSNASSEGAFVTDDYYVGKHGRSQRLIGLDPSNDNALSRAIVVHGAWYVSPGIIAEHGMLGRSQGCFAVAEDDLAAVFRHLGPGRMIYAAKV
jgi:hypothetical protein